MKEKIEEIVKKVQSDPKMLENFKNNPAKVVKDLIGVDLPEDQVYSVVEAVKTKINLNDIGGSIKGLLG